VKDEGVKGRSDSSLDYERLFIVACYQGGLRAIYWQGSCRPSINHHLDNGPRGSSIRSTYNLWTPVSTRSADTFSIMCSN
jgi:hypothetical protein